MDDEWVEYSSALEQDVIPVPYPFREDWDTFEFPDASPPARLYDATASHAAVENSLYGEIENLVVEQPLTPTAQTPPPAPQRQRETRRARRARKRRQAAEAVKARLCHNIFCRLPR